MSELSLELDDPDGVADTLEELLPLLLLLLEPLPLIESWKFDDDGVPWVTRTGLALCDMARRVRVGNGVESLGSEVEAGDGDGEDIPATEDLSVLVSCDVDANESRTDLVSWACARIML